MCSRERTDDVLPTGLIRLLDTGAVPGYDAAQPARPLSDPAGGRLCALCLRLQRPIMRDTSEAAN